MTVFLRALYGPFGREAVEHRSTAGAVLSSKIDWHFFGIREDNTMGRWCVQFKVLDRTWTSHAMPMAFSVKVGAGWVVVGPLENPDAFVPERPMLYGPTYLAILKSRLSKDDIAFASRMAIAAVR